MLTYRRVWFHFESTNNDIRWVNFYLDNKLLGTVESDNGYFDLEHNSLTVGYHSLKLEIFTGSGSGSIADSLGIEGNYFSTKEWIIKVLDAEFWEVTTTVADGFMKLRWPPLINKSPEFIIYRGSTEIGRTHSSEFTDKGYVGQGATYSIYYVDETDNYKTVTLGQVEVPEETRIKYNFDSDNNYFITWEKPRYYAAIDTVVLVSWDNSYARSFIQRVTDINQLSIEIPDSLFGRQRKYWMIPVPQYPNPPYTHSYSYSSPYASPSIEFIAGYPSPAFNDFFRVGNTEFIYHAEFSVMGYRDSLLRYSTTDNRIIDRAGPKQNNPYVSGLFFVSTSVSPDGSIYTANAGLTHKAVVGSANDLNNYKITDLSNITNPSIVAKMPISNIGTGIIINSDNKLLYDFVNETILGTFGDATWLSGYHISPDGEYFYLRVSHTIWLYSYRNSVITPERTIHYYDSPFFDYFSFAREAGIAAGWDSSTKTFYKVRCSDMGITQSFPVTEEQILDVDFYNDRILSFSPYLLVVRSLTDGSVLFEIPVSFQYIPAGMFRLCGNSIFQNEGVRYYLK